MPLALGDIVQDFATGLTAADAKRPAFVSRTGRAYQPGIGPHGEERAVALILDEMKAAHAGRYSKSGQSLAYPGSKQKCDLWFGDPLEWAIEVKMARFFGDNGKPDDTSLKDLLSPYEAHRSALTDTVKLASSTFPGHNAVLIYGFAYEKMALEPAIDAFEVLARERVRLGPRQMTPIDGLVHPVHARGAVYGWEVEPILSHKDLGSSEP